MSAPPATAAWNGSCCDGDSGSELVLQTDARRDLRFCADDGSHCMSIHSFCADAVWTDIRRDHTGRVEGGYAPHLGRPMDAGQFKRLGEPPLAATRGGISHPAEWAWRMGLPFGSS